MDDKDKKDDSLALDLYRKTMTGQWDKVVEIYGKNQIKAISAKINQSGDTAFHAAVSIAPEEKVGQLVRVIKKGRFQLMWHIKKIKEKHVHSVQIMKLLIKRETRKGPPSSSLHPTTDSDTTTGSQTDFEEKKDERCTSNIVLTFVDAIDLLMARKGETSKLVNTETPVLLAAKNGITFRLVKQILEAFPLAINDQIEGKDIVLWVVKNRQPRVLQLVLKRDFVKCKLIHEVDTKKNNALHLATKRGEKKPWLIPGAALQMQWKIKWYEFVKDTMPKHFCYQLNEKGKTPEEIFNKTHEELVKQGGEWLNKTSKSCLVVVALIATIAFAVSTTIPGDINEKSGKPNLENQSKLTIFAISSLVALCFSISALFSFLAMLTSQYEHKDFRRDLPKKLLLAISSLFVSITSMLVSFCAGHFFMLKNKLKDNAFPIYAATCLPIVFFAIQQLPLYLDIVWAIFKKVPQSSCKAISL
ncbi:hypothetical protein ACB092_10G204600 [Castanea dentata]